mmetsp:Transcript_23881/g.43359  ORF Transcript_23881/g.43359 Transcript_23881/m.43359 type:complete len:110 (+) Transcript_23881:188-517(+)
MLILSRGHKEVTMPNLRLTRRTVDDIPHPEHGQAIYRDTMLPGFGVRVGAKSKTYIVEGQVNRRTRRVTIGRADLFPPETARRKALVVLGTWRTGSIRQLRSAKKLLKR